MEYIDLAKLVTIYCVLWRHFIDYFQTNIRSPQYYVFTDDQDWVNENFRLDNAVYVSNMNNIMSYFVYQLPSHLWDGLMAKNILALAK